MLPLALTLGDAAGIGPELILRLLATAPPYPVDIYANAHILNLTAAKLRKKHPKMSLAHAQIVPHAQAHQSPRTQAVRIIDVSERLPTQAQVAIASLTEPVQGKHFAPFAHLQLAALRLAIKDTQAGHVRAICTAPWNKALFQTAGLPSVGHTEVLGQDTDAKPVMMLGGDRLRVSLVTTHLPLARVADALTQEKILFTARTTQRALKQWWNIKEPQIAIAALNPHAGEGGTMGTQEQDIITPAIAQLQREGCQVSGPWPADTLFAKARRGSAWPYDAVVCMYHDQGLIPLKMLHFGNSANITLGLPLVRTSVDHGTAYDIAGKGVASLDSLRYALSLADHLSNKARPNDAQENLATNRTTLATPEQDSQQE